MKLLLVILLSTAMAGFSDGGSIYDYSITTIESQTHSLGEYQGKKILIMVLPASQTADDSAYLQKMDSVALANSSGMAVIGIPSYEDGYNDSLLTTLQPFYRSLLDTSIIISQGMYTHQSSDSLQNPLFNWLTHVSGNTHFEQEVGGAGEMYFINEQGELYGVFGPEVRMSTKILNRMLQ
ncbi:MAG TPA: hypothetical protein VG738_19115 [Chitinophagaceae bacterium]|nr:hypothetical protein [Chitinophagaceae bacterium]